MTVIILIQPGPSSPPANLRFATLPSGVDGKLVWKRGRCEESPRPSPAGRARSSPTSSGGRAASRQRPNPARGDLPEGKGAATTAAAGALASAAGLTGSYSRRSLRLQPHGPRVSSPPLAPSAQPRAPALEQFENGAEGRSRPTRRRRRGCLGNGSGGRCAARGGDARGDRGGALVPGNATPGHSEATAPPGGRCSRPANATPQLKPEPFSSVSQMCGSPTVCGAKTPPHYWFLRRSSLHLQGEHLLTT
ncbi:nascent polypeptide-associated complex subunit alpha, muscle-specific form-like [Sapajus apella]|uniref:Nascent polypeptide-associated complex subunit alpha, muscle-specific form-like n=1 Tax=Sapajus apella TaxID=9515 RepID=A0A6J3HC31_SAPAP|nr:nascent polypeptide-associated complex subunit alpha, muscle-specific form-like [Sapajus apella]